MDVFWEASLSSTLKPEDTVEEYRVERFFPLLKGWSLSQDVVFCSPITLPTCLNVSWETSLRRNKFVLMQL